MLQRSCWRCGWPTSCGTGPASPSKFASRRTAVHCAASGNLQVRDALRAEEGQHAAAAAVGLPVVKHALSAGEAHTCIADTMHRVWHSRARVRATETRKRRTHRVLACVRQSHQHRALLDDEPLVAAQAQASSAVAAGPARHEDASRRCGAAGAVVHRLLDRARAADLVSISRGKAGRGRALARGLVGGLQWASEGFRWPGGSPRPRRVRRFRHVRHLRRDRGCFRGSGPRRPARHEPRHSGSTAGWC